MNTNTAKHFANVTSITATGIDPQVIDNIVEFVPNLWATLHRRSRAKDISRGARDRMHQVLGAMPGIWAVLMQNGERKFGSAQERHDLYRKALLESNAKHAIARDMCMLLGTLASRRKAIWGEDQDPSCDQLLGWAFWGLIDTGIFSQVPNTFRAPRIFTEALERYCEVLQGFWKDSTAFVQSDKESGAAKVLISRATGLALLEGVRLLDSNPLGSSPDELVAWYQETQVRRQRGFYANVAQGVNDLGLIRKEIGIAIQRAPKQDRQSLRRALKVVERLVENISMTGILSIVPA